MIRAGAFARRSIVELRQEVQEDDRAVLTIMTAGRRVEADVTLARPDGDEVVRGSTVPVRALSKVTHATIRFPRGAARDVKVWAHCVASNGTSSALTATLEVWLGAAARHFDLTLSNGQVVVALEGAECVLRIALGGPAEARASTAPAAPWPSASVPGSSPSP
jgi:hypothetical protein